MLTFNKFKVNKYTFLKQSSNQIWMGWVALFFIVFHFTMIILYAAPQSFVNQNVRGLTISYVEPIFTQKWSMFAPCPVVDAQVEIKYYFENDSTDWVRPAASAVNKHGIYRGSYHGELVLAEANLVYWLGLDLDQLGVEIGMPFPKGALKEFQKGYSYFKIKQYIAGNATYLYEKRPIKASVRCFLKDVESGESGLIELPIYQF